MIEQQVLARTYEDVENFARGCFDHFKENGVTKILGVSRGGLVPATYVAYYFNVPLEITNYSSPDGLGWYPQQRIRFLNGGCPFSSDDVILIIDDDADTGATLRDLKGFFDMLQIPAFTATINERHDAKFRPDYSLFKIPRNVLMEYPWNIDVNK